MSISLMKKVSLGLVLEISDKLRSKAAIECSSSVEDQHNSGVLSRDQLRASRMGHEVWFLQIRTKLVCFTKCITWFKDP